MLDLFSAWLGWIRCWDVSFSASQEAEFFWILSQLYLRTWGWALRIFSRHQVPHNLFNTLSNVASRCWEHPSRASIPAVSWRAWWVALTWFWIPRRPGGWLRFLQKRTTLDTDLGWVVWVNWLSVRLVNFFLPFNLRMSWVILSVLIFGDKPCSHGTCCQVCMTRTSKPVWLTVLQFISCFWSDFTLKVDAVMDAFGYLMVNRWKMRSTDNGAVRPNLP